MKIIISVLIVLFLIGCGGSRQPEPVSYPSWFLNPPANDGSYLYGPGEGNTIDSAKASALNAIAASLSITVSSEFKKNESSQSFNGNENAYHSALNTVKAEVKAIEFNDYRIIQNEVRGSKTLVLVEVSRFKLFTTQKEKLERFSKELKTEQKNIDRQSPLKKVYLYNQNIAQTQRLTSLALLTKSINSGFDTAPYFQQTADIKQAQSDAIDDAQVSITAEPDAEVFVATLKEGLNKVGIKTVHKGANTRIHLKNSFQTDEIYGFKIAKATLTVSTQDNSRKNIATKMISLSGKSRYDYDKAQASAAQSLSKKIETEGIYSVLGID
jgi:LPP20 lipoprotein